jgi:lycopene cyclase-like protein
VLATRTPIAIAALCDRLHARLARMGITPSAPHERERCVIPLGVELPLPGQRVVAFGAAAGMVHPATGYQLGRVMATAPAVARALASDREPAALAAQANTACWPASRRRAWALYTFGMEALVSFDHAATCAFLRAFFALPQASALAFLKGEQAPAGIALAMARVLAHASPPTRKRLARLLIDHHETFTRAPQENA